MSRTCSRFILFLFLPFLLPFFVLPFFLFPFHLLALSIHSCVEPVNFIYQLGITGVIKGDDLFRIGGSRNLFTYNFQRFVGKRYGRSRKGKIRMSIRRGRNGEKLRERIIKKRRRRERKSYKGTVATQLENSSALSVVSRNISPIRSKRITGQLLGNFGNENLPCRLIEILPLVVAWHKVTESIGFLLLYFEINRTESNALPTLGLTYLEYVRTYSSFFSSCREKNDESD